MSKKSTIILYNSETPNAAPNAANLVFGELALNYADGILYYKSSNSAILQLVTANLSSIVFQSFDIANAAFNKSNLAFDNSNSGFLQANVANSIAVQSGSIANAAFLQANSAFNAANNRVLKTGDTITGILNVANTLLTNSLTTFDLKVESIINFNANSAGIDFNVQSGGSYRVRFYNNGTKGIYFSSNVIVGETSFYGFGDGATNNTSPLIYKDANNAIGIRNSTNTQEFRLYATYTDSSNYERLTFKSAGTDRFVIGAENTGSGGSRYVQLVTQTGSIHSFASDPTLQGALGITNGNARLWSPSNGNLRLTNNNQNDFNMLMFGGITASFPALKRTTTTLSVRLADDSGPATFQVGNIALSNTGTISTSSPSGGTANTWKLGSVTTASVTLDTTKYVEVEIGGVAYKLLTAN